MHIMSWGEYQKISRHHVLTLSQEFQTLEDDPAWVSGRVSNGGLFYLVIISKHVSGSSFSYLIHCHLIESPPPSLLLKLLTFILNPG